MANNAMLVVDRYNTDGPDRSQPRPVIFVRSDTVISHFPAPS